ncbi:MAG: Rpn family recombination-promoting nuclease/putative transposase [Mangrovibacterium sp.]
MRALTEKYLNPFTDYGFKRLFGQEASKELLVDFLNELLREENVKIENLTYLRNEQVGRAADDRRAVFDLYCENQDGEKFIVELQKNRQDYFKDRMLYYSTFPIQGQAKPSHWNFELRKVYAISILDFIFHKDDHPDKYRYDIKLTEQETKEVFYDKLMFVYLEMPKFNKTLEELETRFDKWLYILRNMTQLDNIPNRLRERIFESFFRIAEIAKLSNEEYDAYEGGLKNYRDVNNIFDTARREGEAKGRVEEKSEVALKMLQSGSSIDFIMEISGLSRGEIELLMENK